MGDDGEQRPRRSARRALALLPVPDGLDGHAKPCREFELGQPRTAAQVAHRRQRAGSSGVRRCMADSGVASAGSGIAGASGNSRPSRSSTIRPSAFSRKRCMFDLSEPTSSAKRVKARLTINWRRSYFSPNHSVAMPRNEKKPTTSVMVVTKVPDATAGSAPHPLQHHRDQDAAERAGDQVADDRQARSRRRGRGS